MIGRQTSIAGAPGTQAASIQPTFAAISGSSRILNTSLITLCKNEIALAVRYPASMMMPGASEYQPKPAPIARDSGRLSLNNRPQSAAPISVPTMQASGNTRMRKPASFIIDKTVPSSPRSRPTKTIRIHSPILMPRLAALSNAAMFSPNSGLATR